MLPRVATSRSRQTTTVLPVLHTEPHGGPRGGPGMVTATSALWVSRHVRTCKRPRNGIVHPELPRKGHQMPGTVGVEGDHRQVRVPTARGPMAPAHPRAGVTQPFPGKPQSPPVHLLGLASVPDDRPLLPTLQPVLRLHLTSTVAGARPEPLSRSSVTTAAPPLLVPGGRAEP